MVTKEQLRAARARAQETRGPYDEALKERRRLAKEALEQGMKPAHVAKEAGFSRTHAGRL